MKWEWVALNHHAPFGSRGYQNIGYTPKCFATRPKSAVQYKYREIAEKEKALALKKKQQMERELKAAE